MESVVNNRADPAKKVLATMKQGAQTRDVLVARSRPEWEGGKVLYFRATNSNRYTGGRLHGRRRNMETHGAPLRMPDDQVTPPESFIEPSL